MPADRPALTKPVTRVYVNQETGEELVLEHEEPVQKRRPRDVRASEAFGIHFPSGIARLGRMRLSGTDRAVLDDLVTIMGFEAPFKYSPEETAARLEILPTNVTRSIRNLKAAGVLIETDRLTVWINPTMFWRGSLKARMETIYRLEQAEKIRAADAAREVDGGRVSDT